jgi:hypothetical protein
VKLVAKRIGPPLNTNNRQRNTVLMMTQNRNSNSSSNRNFLFLGSNLKILRHIAAFCGILRHFAAWSASLPVNSDLIVNQNVQPPAFDLRRHRVLLNRFRTEQGRCAHLMHRWGFMDSPGAEEQTMHIVVDCSLRLFADGLTELCAMSDSGVSIWFGLESLMNVFSFKIMVIRINK